LAWAVPLGRCTLAPHFLSRFHCFRPLSIPLLLVHACLASEVIPTDLQGESDLIGEVSPGDLSLPARGELEMEIDSATGRADRIEVAGDVSLGDATLQLKDLGDSLLPPGTKLTLIAYSGSLNGRFSNVADGGKLAAGLNTFTLRYADGGAVTLSTPVPGEHEYNAWAARMGLDAEDAEPTADPDHDGHMNLMEFALDGRPGSSATGYKVSTTLAVTSDDVNSLVITLPVRAGAVFPGSGPMVSNPVDGVIYTVEGSADLPKFGALALSEIEPLGVEVMPELSDGWEYRSFRTESDADLETAFLRVRVDPAP
jgi:hypothetical protein